MSVKPVPWGCGTVTLWVVSRGTVRLIGSMEPAFGVEELACLAGGDGAVGHAEVRGGGSVVLMGDAWPEWPAPPGSLCLGVGDADVVHCRAVAVGVISVTGVTHVIFGDRVGRVRDPLGGLYRFRTRVEELTPQERERRLGDAESTKAMECVQSAGFFP
ncbi:VOC family protein [Streptomyces sp. NPDC091215]|uniref:VOC family protein n=1 Tax=Streptomyces sp. NPDC091215 TaxID=3155192 RepID=UPI00342D45E9